MRVLAARACRGSQAPHLPFLRLLVDKLMSENFVGSAPNNIHSRQEHRLSCNASSSLANGSSTNLLYFSGRRKIIEKREPYRNRHQQRIDCNKNSRTTRQERACVLGRRMATMDRRSPQSSPTVEVTVMQSQTFISNASKTSTSSQVAVNAFCNVYLSPEDVRRTRTAKNCGENPRWGDKFFFTVSDLGAAKLLVDVKSTDDAQK